MSLLEAVGVTLASGSINTVGLAPLNTTMASDGNTSFLGEAEARDTAAGAGPTLSARGVTSPSSYPRRTSLLWTLILSTSISAVDHDATSKLIRDEVPFPDTPFDVNNPVIGLNFGTSLRTSRIDPLLKRLLKKTSVVLDTGNTTSSVNVGHERDGREGVRQAKSFTTASEALGPDEVISLRNVKQENETLNVSSLLSFHLGNTNVALQPDEGKLMEGSSPSTAASPAKFVAPPEIVTSNVDTVAHLLDFRIKSLRTTPGEPETLSLFPPPSTPLPVTTADSPQGLTTSDQTSGDNREVLTTSIAQTTSADINHTAIPPENETRDTESSEPELDSNGSNPSLLGQNVSDMTEVWSISIDSGVLPESRTTHTVTSEFTVLVEETTEPSDVEASMPESPDSDLEMVEILPTGPATLYINQTTINGVDTLLPESVSPDVMTPEPLDVHAGLPEPQNPTSAPPDPINEETIIPHFQNSDPVTLQPEELGGVFSQPEINDTVLHIPGFHMTDILQSVTERFPGNWSNETMNATEESDSQQRTQDGAIDWSASRILLLIIQFVIMVETVLGNLMVILSVKVEKKLQTPFNFYIVNLAFTDMNVGLSVMSLFMVYNLYDYFPLGTFLCDYWIWSDYTMTFESVMTLAAISLDRLWSVTWSLHYRQHNSGRKSVYIILATWCLVALIWLPPFIYDRVTNTYTHGDCYWDTVLNKNLVVYVGFLGYYSPLLVMVGAYARILWVVRKRAASIRDAGRKLSIGPTTQPTESSESGTAVGGEPSAPAPTPTPAPARDDRQVAKLRREMKAVYTLLNIVVIFLICWVPFYTLFVESLHSLWGSCSAQEAGHIHWLSAWYPTLFPSWFVTFSYWMAYINSALNPILYPLSSPEFRAAYKKVFYTVLCKK